MPILKSLVTPHGAAVTFHKPGSGEMNFAQGVVVVRMLSWINQAAHDAGAGHIWSEAVSLAISNAADVEAAMLVSGPFAGGSLVADVSAGLEARRARQWALLKQQREAREFGGFWWDDSFFDSDSESRNRIMGAVQLAIMAKTTGQAFERTWVLADNTTRLLDADEMLAVGLALGAHVGALFDQGVALRAALLASAEPEAIGWPTSGS